MDNTESFKINNPKKSAMIHSNTATGNLICGQLPEMLFVDTCLVTKEYALTNKLESFQTLNRLKVTGNTGVITNGLKKSYFPTISLDSVYPKSVDASVMTDVADVIDAETMTDGPIPSRERDVQTETPDFHTIGIQCDLDNPESSDEFGSFPESHEQEQMDEKTKFEEFVRSKVCVYDNGYSECQLCAEIILTKDNANDHMAIHWGPSVLCSYCGVQFEHEVFLKKHNCIANRKKKPKFQYLCPNYRCRFVAISPLELYEHINEHCNELRYGCDACNRGFKTAGELRCHRHLRFICFMWKSNLRKCLQFGLKTKQDFLYRRRVTLIHQHNGKVAYVKRKVTNMLPRYICQICFNYCSNSLKYSNHLKRCMQHYRTRNKKELRRHLKKSKL